MGCASLGLHLFSRRALDLEGTPWRDLFAEPFNHRPRVYRGPLEEECRALLQEFFASLRDRPGDNVK